MTYPVLTLKPGNEIHLKNRHPAIFRNAVMHFAQTEDGGIVEVQSAAKEFLCYATYNSQAYICARAISFEKGDPMEFLAKTITRSIALRANFFANEDTTAFRLVNAEGDGVPGLIVDQYGDVVVIQLTTLGMDKLREWVTDLLMTVVKPKAVFEKSTGPARKKEGLEGKEGWIAGEKNDDFLVTERGLKYQIRLEGSQKTGLFLDQREMRSLVRTFAKDRSVLDCCSYVGGFSLSALMGGALHADAVDYDAAAKDRARENMRLNGIADDRFDFHVQDVFHFLRNPLPRSYDFIVLDPPAFAKRSSDIEQAKKAYTDLNRLGLQALPPGGLLLTCSCSYQMDTQLFQTVVFHAARQAKRNVRILQRHRHAIDHPVNLYHPEADYLKSMLLWVE